MRNWVNRLAISAKLEMHMIACRVAASANRSDQLPLRYTLPLFRQVATIMRIGSLNAVTVVDNDYSAVTRFNP